MSDPAQDLFRRSLDRCTSDPRFMERFYELFVGSSPDIQKKFKNTDWTRQRRMMADSFLYLANTERPWTDQDPHLRHVAGVHGVHGHQIPAWMFDSWMESLLKAVSETDPDYTDEIGAAWRKTMWKGVAFMKARYNEDRPARA